ncbi:hypothetical protein CI238_11680 [Colletotrichum incanum]|uniref:Uncharacterized protein n=1 Tax=Colletotrichum incanum TaxID=1573173 RepID=A0A167DU75_COLIC|nr:hypothetical protein CI238_11680 [Colletotrichum incanum]
MHLEAKALVSLSQVLAPYTIHRNDTSETVEEHPNGVSIHPANPRLRPPIRHPPTSPPLPRAQGPLDLHRRAVPPRPAPRSSAVGMTGEALRLSATTYWEANPIPNQPPVTIDRHLQESRIGKGGCMCNPVPKPDKSTSLESLSPYLMLNMPCIPKSLLATVHARQRLADERNVGMKPFSNPPSFVRVTEEPNCPQIPPSRAAADIRNESMAVTSPLVSALPSTKP